MFKLESYITPIILNYVTKYVKNIRPEDSQVSLWEGEAAFQNLDLRLDVLEEELNLPFEFLSGHIHELSIQVPWMKINSEPIKFTINTIEFVLKLKDPKGETNPSPKKTEINKRISDVDESSQQQGYMPGLVNKIINNIVINCHNIILKYVEEDIVVSMNIQLLSFSSADESWKPAFTDLHPVRIFMRKLVQVSDLTICLDKRNAAGQIDVCQEPILYRCSLEVRIVRRYNVNTVHLGSVTRIAVFTKLMEMNVSSLQFPMAMRLFKLLLALKAGEYKSKLQVDCSDDDNETQEGKVNIPDSYLSWVWNFIPSFAFSESEEEENVEEDTSGQLMDIGIYIETLNFTLKSSEFITDSIVGATKKIRYSPIVKIILGGIYSETAIIADQNWSNTKAGCSTIAIEPLHSYRDEDSAESSLIQTAPLTNKTFLDRSLFDDTFIEKDWVVTSIDEYNVRVTEEYLLYRSPVIAFDLVEYMEKPEGNSKELEGDQNDNRSRVVYRILVSGLTLQYNYAFARITTLLEKLIRTYDYPPYFEVQTEAATASPKLHPPLLDDYDSLMIGIPLKVYKFYLSGIHFEFHPKTEAHSRKAAKKQTASEKKKLYFKLSIGGIEGKFTSPMDPDKLVHTTCQLPDKPIELLNACYNNLQIRFSNVSLNLQQKHISSKLFNIRKGSANFGDLLQPTLWKNAEIPERKTDVTFENIILEYSKSELITALRVVTLIGEYDEGIIRQIANQDSIKEQTPVKVRVQFKRFYMKVKQYPNITIIRGSLKALESHILRPASLDTDLSRKIVVLSTRSSFQNNKWMEWYAQMPLNCSDNGCPTKSVLCVWIEEFNLNVDENVVDFLKFLEPLMTANNEAQPELVSQTSTRTLMQYQSSRKSLTSDRNVRRVCYPEETVHASSERDEKTRVETSREKELSEQFSYIKIVPYLKTLVINVGVASGKVRITSGKKQDAANYTLISLPKIQLYSALADGLTRYNVQNELQYHTGKKSKDTFPWTCIVHGFHVQSSLNNSILPIVHPIQTSITFAMTFKKEFVSLSKTDQQQPNNASPHEHEAEKSRQNPATSQSAPSIDSQRTAGGGSVSNNGRSISSESGDQTNKAPERRRNLLEAMDSAFSRRKKTQTRDVVSISLHADTSPIHLYFDSERTKLTREHISLLLNAISLFRIYDRPAIIRCPQDEIKIVAISEENASIKHFLDIDTNSETSVVSSDRSIGKLVPSILLQWTITKFTVELDALRLSKFKLIIEMEDLISSVDKREDYTKFTSKIGTLNTNFFELCATNEPILSDRLRVKMETASTQSQFINIIITTVGVSNFFKKIGAKRKEPHLCREISEVIVKMEAIEIIADIDKIAVVAPAIREFTDVDGAEQESEPHNKPSLPCTASKLPMVHLDSKGFTIYMPTETKKPWCTVLIMKVDSIKVSPNLQNPLQRCPVRRDVYQKAAQLGILCTPGSIIEDRQYELTLHNISAASGNWIEILAHMKEHSDNFHTTNPAFEWNNQSRKSSLDVRRLFSNFTFITTYAPCITCDNVLVCGQAMEFNCSNDLVLELSTDQLSLISCIITKIDDVISPQVVQRKVVTSEEKLRKTNSKTTFYSRSKRGSTGILSPKSSLDTILDVNRPAKDDYSEKPVTDSGFSSSRRSVTNKTLTDNTCNNLQTEAIQMPHTTSFVAGLFIINLYTYKRTVRGIPTGDVPTIEETLTPLISATLSQPSFHISQTLYEVHNRISVFNLSISQYPLSESIDEDYIFAEDKLKQPEILFSTKRGELGSSGIPPPLIVIKSHITKSKKRELDVTISKPVSMQLSENSLNILTSHIIMYYEALLENPCFNIRSEKPLFRGTKLEMMKLMLLKSDLFNLNADKLSFKFSENTNYNLKINLVDLRMSAKFLTRPEKMNAKASVGGLYVQSGRKIIVHPIGIKLNVDFIQESWNRLPLVTANWKFNVIHCDVGAEIIGYCFMAMKSIQTGIDDATKLWDDFLHRCCGDSEEINRDRLMKLSLPEVGRKKITEQKEEFYQDDLRAGAFQFVEMVSDSFLPMPYQIQIIKKNYGIICWRYPQPRKMFKIHIFPVPMAVPNPIRIKCRMEYFSEVHEGFLHYCDFWLSETVSKSIELPDREITANIWRVVILQSLVSIDRECFDTSEEDEELRSIVSIGIDDILNSAKNESDFILHPKVLVGCMRIDTVFRPSAIPKFQILVKFNEFQINLQNQQSEKSQLPPILKKFKLSGFGQPMSHTFLSISIEKANLHASFHALSNYSVHSEMTLGVKCLDYGYLNLIYVMEPTYLTGYFRINGNARDTNIVADKLSINLGPSILHNLLCSIQNWENHFSNEEEKQNILISKFIVVNRVNMNISFGQTNTDERIMLESKECCTYSFLSDAANQELTFYILDGTKEHISDSVPITLDFPSSSESIIKHIAVDDKFLVIKTCRLSATQYYIVVKGQIELISMVRNSFQLDFYSGNKNANQEGIYIGKKGRTTLLQPVTHDDNIWIRLRMEESNSKGQTGNIPLKSNKNYPWLVKVPVEGPEKFISYWVRIIRESIEELRTETYHPEKILITIWPIFELRSMMTCPINALEKTTNNQFILPPEGKTYTLMVPATHQTTHEISFEDDFKSAPDFNLTLMALDWNKFFWYDENVWTVEKTLDELRKRQSSKWPTGEEEELRTKRTNMCNTKTSLIYKCFPSREFSCTLSLLVAPWGTFINTTGQTVAVHDSEKNETTEIAANAIGMLPMITSEFTLQIVDGQSRVSSLPIIFDSLADTSKRKCYRLNESDSTDIIVLRGEKVYKLRLEFSTDNERNIFILRPKYVVVNMTKIPLTVLPFSLDHKENISRKDITNLKNRIELPVTNTSDYSLGLCVDWFCDVNVTKATRSPDSAFIFFVCIKLGNKSEISMPIALMHPFNRKCFSLQQDESSVPFSASLLEKNGQYFVSIFEDPSPMILFNNQTDLTLIVAQTNTAENTKVSNTIPEYNGRHFEWYQISRPRSKLYYTPPTTYANFPDVELSQCNLAIALYNENYNKKNIKWSKSIQTDASWEKFLHIPTHGDVKIIVCDKHRIIRVSIFYIAQQLEFSVKDLRSRLLTPQANDSPENSRSDAELADNTNLDYEPIQRVQPSESSECIHQSADPTVIRNMPFKIKFTINEINVNIFVECKTVDYLKKEIFALYIDDFLLTYDNTKRALNLIISNMQIDNQLFSSGNYDFPVVLCSQELYKRSPSCSKFFIRRCNEECRPIPMAEIHAIFYDDEIKIRSINCRVSPIRAYIEDTYLNDLLDYLVECAPSNVILSPNPLDFCVKIERGEYLVPRDIVAQALYISEPLKMQHFRIESTNVMLSVHTCVRLYIALDHSPLQFSNYERRDILTLPLRFGHTIGMHYLSGALFGAGWVVGSLEMLGSPSGLARSFSVGLKDFVSMPVQGLLRGPWGFVVGVTQGSASLLRNITAGTVNSVSKLAASVSRNLDRLTLDPEHIQRTEALRRCRPQGFTEGFTQGITGLGISILGAVGGIARHTLEARSPTEVVTGMGKGIFGALAKPISGAAELLALTGQGVLHTVGFNAMPQQRAPSVPRNIAAQVSEHKLRKQLLNTITPRLENDQVLFYHEVTFEENTRLRTGMIFLTSTVFALYEIDSGSFSFVNPTQRVDISFDPKDKTLLHISVSKLSNEFEEGSFYTTHRIMSFLQTSSHFGMSISADSLDDIMIQKDLRQKNRSLYISEHLGQYLIEYLKIINLKNT